MKKYLSRFLFCVLIFVSCLLQAQKNKTNGEHTPTIDSLQNFLKTSKEDTSNTNTLNLLARQFINAGNYEHAMQYAHKAQQQARNKNYQKGIADSYNNIGIIYWYHGDYEKALDNYLNALRIRQEIGDKKGIASSYGNIGNVYEQQGNYKNALDDYLKALKIQEESGDKKGIPNSYNNIGGIYFVQGNYEKALDYFQKCSKSFEETGNKIGACVSYNNIGDIYRKQGNYEKSLENHLKCLKISEEIKYKQLTASSYANIGLIYSDQGNYAKALDNYLKCLKISEEVGDKRGIGLSYINIGLAYTKLGRFEEAYHYLNQAETLDKETGYKQGIEESYLALSDLFVKKGDFRQAHNYHKLYSDMKDTLLNEKSSKQILEMNTKYDSEKKDKELIKKDAEISRQQVEAEKQNLQRNAFIIGFALVLLLVFFIYRGYRQKQNANKLLEVKNVLIENQKQLVEEKNLKITDSINYAKRIQQAILPSKELIKSALPDSFIFFRPKDIVSGDFYWFSEKNDKIIIAVADCTGHGVPGAFMSMIGNTLLDEIVNVKNIFEPDQILNHLNKSIVNTLHQGTDKSATQDDGMDITILSINKKNKEIEFAGANHFSYLFGDSQLKILHGDVFSIGGMFGKEDINFTSQKIKIESGSSIYLFTDGFIDQFGGEKNSKFLSCKFEQLLQSIQQCDMKQQQERLTTAFDDWKGNNKQLDDVLVFGIRL